MVKSELTELLLKHDKHNLSRSDCVNAVAITLDKIIDCLNTGDRVELRGFGVFYMRHLSPRKNNNPATGERVYLRGRKIGSFKSSKILQDKVNSKYVATS